MNCVNTRVSRIARRQAVMGDFTVTSSPSLEASKDESDDGSAVMMLMRMMMMTHLVMMRCLLDILAICHS